MDDKEESAGGEQDDISFLRTVSCSNRRLIITLLFQNDIVALTCISSHTKDDITESGRVCMSVLMTHDCRRVSIDMIVCLQVHRGLWQSNVFVGKCVRQGANSRLKCNSNSCLQNRPPDIASCMFYIDNALSVRALQEMMSCENEMVGHGGCSELLMDTSCLQKGASGGGGGHKTLLYGHAVQVSGDVDAKVLDQASQ